MLCAQILNTIAFLIVLNVLQLVASGDQHTIHNTHSTNNFNIHKVSTSPDDHLSYEIKLHGFLLWVSVGFLMPISILIKRLSNTKTPHKKLRIILCIHAITQILVVLITAIGGIMSIKYLDNSFNNNHQRIGLVFYALLWLQTLASIFRPTRGSRGRSVWFLFHWLVGISASLLGIINIYIGLQAYHKRTSSKDARSWTLIFMVEMFFIVFLYILQEKWDYIWKQPVAMAMPTPTSWQLDKGTSSLDC